MILLALTDISKIEWERFHLWLAILPECFAIRQEVRSNLSEMPLSWGFALGSILFPGGQQRHNRSLAGGFLAE